MTYPMAPFTLHHPASAAEALDVAAAYPGALFLAGGTDLVVNLRKRLAEPEHVISLSGAQDLRGIAVRDGWLELGALSTMAELASHSDVLVHAPALAEAAAVVAGPTVRGMATLGGNILLDTRCKYYNQSHFWRQANDFCLKKDGTVCHVAPKGDVCWAAFSADTPAALLVMDAQLVIATGTGGHTGERTVALADFYGTDGRWSIGQTPGGLAPGELLTRVRLPLPEAEWTGAYEKLRVRDSIDYPLAGVALRVRRADGGKVTGLRLALTAVNPAPVEVSGLEDLTGAEPHLVLVEELARRAGRVAKPLRTTVADAAYRRAMVGALIEKATARLAPELAAPLAEKARWA